jgi:hypothetical protein
MPFLLNKAEMLFFSHSSENRDNCIAELLSVCSPLERKVYMRSVERTKNLFSAVRDKTGSTVINMALKLNSATAAFNTECKKRPKFDKLFKGFVVGLTALFCVSSPTFAAMDLGEGTAFFNSAIDCLKVLVIALGIGLGGWGVVNLLEGYGNDNPGAKSQGMKQLMAGAGVAVVGAVLIPKIKDVFSSSSTSP